MPHGSRAAHRGRRTKCRRTTARPPQPQSMARAGQFIPFADIDRPTLDSAIIARRNVRNLGYRDHGRLTVPQSAAPKAAASIIATASRQAVTHEVNLLRRVARDRCDDGRSKHREMFELRTALATWSPKSSDKFSHLVQCADESGEKSVAVAVASVVSGTYQTVACAGCIEVAQESDLIRGS